MARTTRQTRANVEVEQSAQPTQARSQQQSTPLAEPRPKRGRRKATPSEPEAQVPDRQVSEPAANTSANTTAGTKRRLRSTKQADSPLRALPEQPTRTAQRKKKTPSVKKAPSPKPEAAPELEEQGHGQVQDDGDQGIFFQKNGHTQVEENPLLLEVREVRETNSQLQRALDDTTSEKMALTNEIMALTHANMVLTQEKMVLNYQLFKANQRTEKKDAEFKAYRLRYPDIDPLPDDTPPSPLLKGSEEALALLHMVESSKYEGGLVEEAEHNGDSDDSDMDVEEALEPPLEASPVRVAKQPPAPAAQSTPKRGGFISSIMSSILSPFSQRKTEPTVTTTPPSSGSLAEALTPTPSSVGERPSQTKKLATPTQKKTRRSAKSKSKTKAKSKKMPTDKVYEVILQSFSRDDQPKADAWIKDSLAKVRSQPAMTEEKLNSLDTDVIIDDLLHLPSCLPWESGFGDIFGDYDDSDKAPAWAVLYDMVASLDEHQDKKRKSSHKNTATEVPSLNEVHGSSATFNSGGNSASLHDLQPRRSIVPSPMFDNPVIHREGGNVFSELQGQGRNTTTDFNDRAALERELRRSGHVPGSGSFQVPEGDSDEEDDDADLWTQQPPPPPVPAHASLPVSISGTPSVPAMQADPIASTTQPVDEIERQRQKLMKHTPAKPSRLREAMFPSPSLKSDVGNESIVATTPVQIAAPVDMNMPDWRPLELDDPVLESAAQEFVASADFKAAANAWSDPILTYDEDEIESDE